MQRYMKVLYTKNVLLITILKVKRIRWLEMVLFVYVKAPFGRWGKE